MNQDLNKQTTPMRLIVAAMMMGLLTFSVIALVVGSRITPNPNITKLLLGVLALMSTMEFLGFFVLRKAMIASLRGQITADIPVEEAEARLLPSWNTLILIRSAMMEGIGLFGAVIALITGLKVVLLVPAIILSLFVLGFPSQDKLSAFTADLTGRNPYVG